uniref:Putative 5'-nucleotidase/apyrase n=1 Tax=Ixodes ricinus TaxID=34613 RepID=A0A0K8RJY4_IXORI
MRLRPSTSFAIFLFILTRYGTGPELVRNVVKLRTKLKISRYRNYFRLSPLTPLNLPFLLFPFSFNLRFSNFRSRKPLKTFLTFTGG